MSNEEIPPNEVSKSRIDCEHPESEADPRQIAPEQPRSRTIGDSQNPIEATVIGSESETPTRYENPVLAEFANPDAPNPGTEITASVSNDSFSSMTPLPIARNLENLSAIGGAVGSLVLGVWCVLGSFITTWSIINGFLGLAMGIWGLTSRKQRIAWLGIVLCVIGILLSLVQVSELINSYLNQVDENPY